MKLEEIIETWEKDAKIDISQLDTEALKIPQIHHKYYKLYIPEKIKLKKQKEDFKILKRKKWEYYNNYMDPSEVHSLGWEPLQKKLLKQDIDKYIDSDKHIIEENLKIAVQEEKVLYLEDILKNLKNRNFNLRVAMDFIKFTNGN